MIINLTENFGYKNIKEKSDRTSGTVTVSYINNTHLRIQVYKLS